jgi:hypothetical protein
VISSIDWFFSLEEFGLILEDDLQFDEMLFVFASWAFEHFQNDENIWLLAGTNFLSVSNQLSGHLQFPNYPVTWGWATWRAKWSAMRDEIVLLDSERRNFFQFDAVLNFWKIGASRAKMGIIDAWDIPLAEAMQRLGKVSLVSPMNLVKNIGYTELASNTHKRLFPLDLEIEQVESVQDFRASLERHSIIGKDVNTIYEKTVYGISFKNKFSSLFSIFDKLRFPQKSAETLEERLNRLSVTNYEIL